MKIKRLVEGSYECNGYIIYDEGEGIVIDPGDNPQNFIKEINELGISLKGVYLTHHHHDHVGAVKGVSSEFFCPVYIHRSDGDMYKGEAIYLENGDKFTVGKYNFKVINTPGHTKGSVCYMCREKNQVFTGDTIFSTDLGRTDLIDGSEEEQRESIKNIVSLWSNEIFISPGHGEGCTMKKVREFNPEYIDIMKTDEKKNIKLVALDLDGTTLNKDGVLSDRTKNALRKTMEKGVHVVIATGRCYSAIPSEIKEMDGIEYLVTSNGGLTVNNQNGETIAKECIDEAEIVNIIRVLESMPHMIEIFVDGKAYMEKTIYEGIIKGEITYRHSEYIAKTRMPIENVLNFARRNSDAIENINVFFKNLEDKAEAKPILDAIPNVTITTSLINNWEIGGKNTSKAAALKVLMEKLNISKDEVMACGDNSNDYEMLKMAGIKVAMDNGNEEIMKVAKFVVSSNEFDGVAEAIGRFVL